MAQACNPSAKETRGSLGSLPANQSTPSANLQANKRPCLKEGGCVFCGQPKVVLWPPHTQIQTKRFLYNLVIVYELHYSLYFSTCLKYFIFNIIYYFGGRECGCMWKQKSTSGIFLNHFTLFFETGSFTEPGVH